MGAQNSRTMRNAVDQLSRVLWILLACLVQSGHSSVNSTLLSIGSIPATYEANASTMTYFRIDIVNDYCNRPSSVARSACGTPNAVVRLESCVGESWLYANPTSLDSPTLETYDLRSNNGSSTGFIEELSFTLTLGTTYVAVYAKTDAVYQLWVSDPNFNATIVPRVVPSQSYTPGMLNYTIEYSNSIFIPSSIAITHDAAVVSNASTDAISYNLYYLRLGDVKGEAALTNWTEQVHWTNRSMTTACAILTRGTLVSTTTTTSNTFTMSLVGGAYVMAVLGSTDSGYQGSFDSLPFYFLPYDSPLVEGDSMWTMTLVLIFLGILLCLMVTAVLFWCLHSRWNEREHAKELLKEQLERKALMAEGKAYEPAKKHRSLTCWERLTGEIVTNEDEVYGEDGLTTLERRTVVEFESIEMGIRHVPEPVEGRRPSQVAPEL